MENENFEWLKNQIINQIDNANSNKDVKTQNTLTIVGIVVNILYILLLITLFVLGVKIIQNNWNVPFYNWSLVILAIVAIVFYGFIFLISFIFFLLSLVKCAEPNDNMLSKISCYLLPFICGIVVFYFILLGFSIAVLSLNGTENKCPILGLVFLIILIIFAFISVIMNIKTLQNNN